MKMRNFSIHVTTVDGAVNNTHAIAVHQKGGAYRDPG